MKTTQSWTPRSVQFGGSCGPHAGRAREPNDNNVARRRIPDDVRAPLPGPSRLQVDQDSPDAHNGLRPTAGRRPAPECRWSRNLRGQLLGSRRAGEKLLMTSDHLERAAKDRTRPTRARSEREPDPGPDEYPLPLDDHDR